MLIRPAGLGTSNYVYGTPKRENAHATRQAKAVALLKKRAGEGAIGIPVGPEVERTPRGDPQQGRERRRADGRRTRNRVRSAVTHPKEVLSGVSKAQTVTADLIAACQVHWLKEEGAKPSKANYELAMPQEAAAKVDPLHAVEQTAKISDFRGCRGDPQLSKPLWFR